MTLSRFLRMHAALWVLVSCVLAVSHVSAHVWLHEAAVQGGTSFCEASSCSCDGTFNGTRVTYTVGFPQTRCQVYHPTDDSNNKFCHVEHTRVSRLQLFTDDAGRLPEELERGLRYGLLVDLQQDSSTQQYTYASRAPEDFPDIEKVDMAAVKDLTVSLCPTDHVMGNETLSGFSAVNFLTLAGHGARVRLEAPGLLARLTRLLRLQVHRARLQEVRTGDFCSLLQLDEVNITESDPSVIRGFDCATRSFHNLETIDLHGNGIAEVPFSWSRVAPNVVNLSLSSNALTHVASGTFQGLGKLKTLDLSRNRIESVAHDAFDGITLLDTLDLTANRIRHLDFRLRLEHLKTLSLAHNRLREVNSSVLPDDLREVRLQHNGISALRGAPYRSRTRKHMRTLDLRHNALRNFSQGALVDCVDFPCDSAELRVFLYGNR